MFEGAPLVAALALRPEGGELVVRGQLAREPWEQTRAGAARGARATATRRSSRCTGASASPISRRARRSIEVDERDRAARPRVPDRDAADVVGRDRSTSRATVGPGRATRAIPQELPYGTTAGAFGLRAAGGRRADVTVGSAPQRLAYAWVDAADDGEADGCRSRAAAGDAAASGDRAPPAKTRGDGASDEPQAGAERERDGVRPAGSSPVALAPEPLPAKRASAWCGLARAARDPRADRAPDLVAGAVNTRRLPRAHRRRRRQRVRRVDGARRGAGAREPARRSRAVIDVEAVLQEALLRVWQVAPRFVARRRAERPVAARGADRAQPRGQRGAPARARRRSRRSRSRSPSRATPDPLLREAIADCRDKLPAKPRQALDARLAAAATTTSSRRRSR